MLDYVSIGKQFRQQRKISTSRKALWRILPGCLCPITDTSSAARTPPLRIKNEGLAALHCIPLSQI
ncbi:MAG: hypothetical protein IKM26_01950 [Clostridia bacterium]|nr:hypothetical protein [Clostridia bacterium]